MVAADLRCDAGQNVLNEGFKGISGTRKGIHGGKVYPCEIFPCKDGYVSLIAPQIEQWKRLVAVLGTPEWSKEPRYRDRKAIAEQYPDEVNAKIIPWMMEHTKEEIYQLCQDNRVPAVPVYDIAETVNHRQLKEMNYFVELNHSEAGKLKYAKGPCTFEKADWEWQKAAPLLGENNEQVLCERLGYTKTEMTALKKSGVI